MQDVLRLGFRFGRDRVGGWARRFGPGTYVLAYIHAVIAIVIRVQDDEMV